MLPDRNRLIFFYDLFQRSPNQVRDIDLIDFSQMSRFDPRGAEIIVNYISLFYEGLNPFKLRTLNLKAKSPQALCLLLDIAGLNLKTKNSNIAQDFDAFKKCIQSGVPKAPFQSFYVGLYGINPKNSMGQIKKNLTLFETWGYYCDEIPITQKNQSIKKTLISKKKRIEQLSLLLKSKTSICVNDYLIFLNHTVHPRQAERDLKSYPKIKTQGKTKGRIYFLK